LKDGKDAEFTEQMSRNPAFAEAILRPRTDLFMRSIQEKVRFREHVGIEIKGGKSNRSTHIQNWKIHCRHSSMQVHQPTDRSAFHIEAHLPE
jgi:hypothetical protein